MFGFLKNIFSSSKPSSNGRAAKKGALVGAAVMTIAMPFVGHEEGLRTAAYLDAVGVPTICYGETENVRLGDTKTAEECSAMFYTRLGYFAYRVDLMIEPEMSPKFHAALTSWAYNVGLGAAAGSKTVTGRANARDFTGACNGLLNWKNAGGRPILLKRRQRERELCLEGARDMMSDNGRNI